MNNTELMVKAMSVLRSCRTAEQYTVAENYAWRVYERVVDGCSIKETLELWTYFNNSINLIRNRKDF